MTDAQKKIHRKKTSRDTVTTCDMAQTILFFLLHPWPPALCVALCGLLSVWVHRCWAPWWTVTCSHYLPALHPVYAGKRDELWGENVLFWSNCHWISALPVWTRGAVFALLSPAVVWTKAKPTKSLTTIGVVLTWIKPLHHIVIES